MKHAAWFHRYFNTPYWKSVRTAVLEEKKHLCQRCKVRPGVRVLHQNYLNLGREKFEDLIVACNNCRVPKGITLPGDEIACNPICPPHIQVILDRQVLHYSEVQ